MFREVTHTHVETTDSQETVTPLQVMNNSAEEALRREELTSPVSGSKDTHGVIRSDQGPQTPVLSAPSLSPTFTRRREKTADNLVSRCLRSQCVVPRISPRVSPPKPTILTCSTHMLTLYSPVRGQSVNTTLLPLITLEKDECESHTLSLSLCFLDPV